MLKILTSVVISISLILGLTHYTPTADFSLVRQATVVVDAGSGICSGVRIEPKVVLTAAHCDAPEMKVEGKLAIKIKKDEKTDLMLLRVEDAGPFLAVAKSAPKLDEKVVMVGNPLAVGEVATEGRVQDLRSDAPNHLMLVSAPGIFGNSGGPVVVRRGMHYEVVGIVSMVAGLGNMFVMVPITHIMFVVKTDTIRDFVK